MTPEVYFQVNAISLITLFLIFINSRRYLNKSRNHNIITIFIISTIAIIAIDTASLVINYLGASGTAAHNALFILAFIFLVAQVFISFLWLVFCLSYLYGDQVLNKRNSLLTFLPCLIFLIIMLIKPSLIFSIGDGEKYIKEDLFFLEYLFSVGYIVVTSLIVLIEIPKVKEIERKKDLLYLCSFCLLPILAGVVQAFVPELSLIWQMIIASIFLVYINVQDGQISIDGLTGISNRGYLDTYLEAKFAKENKKYWFLIMLDIDNFKQINDVYGHHYGDEALKKMSTILQKTFKQHDTVVSRYGGDEFVIIYTPKMGKGVRSSLEELNKNIEIENTKNGHLPFKLSVSVGYAEWVKDRFKTVEELVQFADNRMYKEKKAKKAKGLNQGLKND